MINTSVSLQTRVHKWINNVGFRLNRTDTDKRSNTTTNHYFFKTFNFVEKLDNKSPQKVKFMAFDAYGEKLKVNTLLDLQTAFFENLN